jgi:hypothetical protein
MWSQRPQSRAARNNARLDLASDFDPRRFSVDQGNQLIAPCTIGKAHKTLTPEVMATQASRKDTTSGREDCRSAERSDVMMM